MAPVHEPSTPAVAMCHEPSTSSRHEPSNAVVARSEPSTSRHDDLVQIVRELSCGENYVPLLHADVRVYGRAHAALCLAAVAWLTHGCCCSAADAWLPTQLEVQIGRSYSLHGHRAMRL